MALYETHRPAAGDALTTQAYLAVLKSVERLTDWYAARQTRKALSRLSDHELSDIGLIRADIDRVAGLR